MNKKNLPQQLQNFDKSKKDLTEFLEYLLGNKNNTLLPDGKLTLLMDQAVTNYKNNKPYQELLDKLQNHEDFYIYGTDLASGFGRAINYMNIEYAFLCDEHDQDIKDLFMDNDGSIEYLNEANIDNAYTFLSYRLEGEFDDFFCFDCFNDIYLGLNVSWFGKGAEFYNMYFFKSLDHLLDDKSVLTSINSHIINFSDNELIEYYKKYVIERFF
jgi:hypothetical protein